MQIERLSASEFEEAMDFINMVFSMAHGPLDFAEFLPRLFKPTDDCMKRNLVVRDNGRIRALVGLYPNIVQAGDAALKLAGIGAVSSHPSDRGRGWMKLLMGRQIEQMGQEGFDLSFLVGQRQRYMYFGYDKTGAMLEYKLNKSNLKHANVFKTLPPIRLEPLRADDLTRIGKAKELHDAQPVHCVRPIEAFYLYLLTGHMQPWAALDPDDKMVGYLVSNPEGSRITELFSQDETALAGMLRAWFSRQNVQEITIAQPSWAQESARYLSGVAEDVVVTNSGNWRIFDWQKVIGALLRVKNTQNRLPDGALCLGIRGYGCLQISVCGEKATCDRSSQQPDVEWDPLTASRVLFGNTPSFYVTSISQSIEPLIASWFPLPLSWLPQNYV